MSDQPKPTGEWTHGMAVVQNGVPCRIPDIAVDMHNAALAAERELRAKYFNTMERLHKRISAAVELIHQLQNEFGLTAEQEAALAKIGNMNNRTATEEWTMERVAGYATLQDGNELLSEDINAALAAERELRERITLSWTLSKSDNEQLRSQLAAAQAAILEQNDRLRELGYKGA